jgi:integrase
MSVTVRERELPSGKTVVYLDCYSKGKRWTESLGLYKLPPNDVSARLHNKEVSKIAREKSLKRALELGAEAHGSNTIRRQESFLRYMKEQGLTRVNPNSRRVWDVATGRFEHFAGNIAFAQIDSSFVKGYKAHLLKELKNGTAWLYFGKFKTALNQAMKDGILAVNPALGVSIRKEDRLPVHLTMTEVRKLAKAPCPNEQAKRAFLFSCFTGLRFSDIEALTWDNVKGKSLEFTQKKKRTPELIPLHDEALAILKKQRKAEPSPLLQRSRAGYVFLLPIHSVVNKALRAWAKAASLEKHVSFHVSRHTFATLGLSAGIDIYTVSKLLGHSNLKTTQIYAQIVDEKKTRAVSKLPRL